MSSNVIEPGPIDAGTQRGQMDRMMARNLVRQRIGMRPYDDPVAMAIQDSNAAPVMAPEAFVTDAHANPSETLNLTLYGQIMAERERLRRQAE